MVFYAELANSCHQDVPLELGLISFVSKGWICSISYLPNQMFASSSWLLGVNNSTVYKFVVVVVIVD